MTGTSKGTNLDNKTNHPDAGTYDSGLTDYIWAEDWNDLAATANKLFSGAVLDDDFSSNGLMKRTASGTYGIITDNSSNWDTAYSWGDHALAGYITTPYTDADAIDAVEAVGVAVPVSTDWFIFSDAGVLKKVLFSGVDENMLTAIKSYVDGQDHDHATPIATHAGVAGAHHTKYTDAEAVTAMGTKGDTNALNHDKTTSLAHSALTSVTSSQHHAKYTDAEAVDAIEAVTDLSSAPDPSDDVIFSDAGVLKRTAFSDLDETVLTALKSYIDSIDDGYLRIKLLPHNLSGRASYTNNFYSYPKSGDAGAVAIESGYDYFWDVDIPNGYKATHVIVYCGTSTDITVHVYEGNVTTIGKSSTKGTSNGNTSINIIDVTGTNTNYLIIGITANGANRAVYGGYVTLARV